MALARVLVVDDEPSIRTQIKHLLEADGCEVATAASLAAARLEFDEQHPEICLLDYQLPDGTAIDLIQAFKEARPDTSVLVLTGHREIELAVSCIKAGAEQFLTKPVELGALRTMVRRLVESRRSTRREAARQTRDEREEPNPFIGESVAIRRLEELARAAAESDSTVLLQGETGAGKGVLARWIHANSSRRREAFVDLNCGGLSREMLDSELFGYAKGAFTGAHQAKPGLFEIADRGTFFLDEIGDIELSLQPKILKVVEEKRFRRLGEVHERRVDTRLIAATHRDLAASAAAHEFRADLYYRLNTFTIRLPPLRERLADLPALAEVLLSRLERETGRRARLGKDAVDELERRKWNGNIRELRNLLEGALLRARDGSIRAETLRHELSPGAPDPRPARAPEPARGQGGLDSWLDFSGTLDELERSYIEHVLRAELGNVERAAEKLAIPRSTLYQRIRTYGLQPAQLRGDAPSGPR
jgi:DNA-binding NtrC family response regulator